MLDDMARGKLIEVIATDPELLPAPRITRPVCGQLHHGPRLEIAIGVAQGHMIDGGSELAEAQGHAHLRNCCHDRKTQEECERDTVPGALSECEVRLSQISIGISHMTLCKHQCFIAFIGF